MAKRFTFRLETLLRLRRLRQREATRKVGRLAAEVARIDQRIRATFDEIVDQQQSLRRAQSGARLDPGDLAAQRAWIAHLRGIVLQNQRLRADAQERLAAARAELTRARTQTRVVEKLRERRWEQYRAVRNRAEQAASDELAQQLLARESSDAEPGLRPR